MCSGLSRVNDGGSALSFRHEQIEVFYHCQIPETFDDVVECEGCAVWFHQKCVGYDTKFNNLGSALSALTS
jgi:hypothetical protein